MLFWVHFWDILRLATKTFREQDEKGGVVGDMGSQAHRGRKALGAMLAY